MKIKPLLVLFSGLCFGAVMLWADLTENIVLVVAKTTTTEILELADGTIETNITFGFEFETRPGMPHAPYRGALTGVATNETSGVTSNTIAATVQSFYSQLRGNSNFVVEVTMP